MKLFIKITLAFFLILFIAIIGFVVIFNPNDYKKDISDLVKEKTGRNLLIQGDISLSLFPWIGIDLGAVEISNAKNFTQHPFAKMAHLQVRAKLWPLFAKRLEADTLVLEGLELNLEKNEQGVTNWDDLLTKTPQSNAIPDAQTNVTPKVINNDKLLAAFALNGIDIKQAQLNWHDQQQKQKVSIKNVHLNLGKLKPETKIPFNLRFHLQEKNVDATISLETNVNFTSNFKRFSFYDTKLTSDIVPAALKKHLFPKFDSPLMQLDIDKQTFSADNLNLSQKELKLTIKIATQDLFSNPQISSHISLQPFNPRKLANDFNISLPDMADKQALTLLQATFDVKGTLKNIDIPNLKITIDQTQIDGNANIKSAPHNSSVNLKISDINIDHYLPTPVSTSSTTTAKNSVDKTTPEAALIPVALLAAFNLDADIKINKLQIKNTDWRNVHLASHSKNGHIKISPLTMQGYESTINSDFIIDVMKDNASLSGDIKTNEIQAGKLFQDFTGNDKLKGKTSLDVRFDTSGIKLSQLKQNLNGKVKLSLNEGTLKDYDLDHQQKVLSAKLKGQTPPATPVPEETKIANLSATANIKKGVLTNNDLRAATPFSRFIGQGTVDLATEKLDYVVSVKFTSSTEIITRTPYEKMNSIPLDIIIKGTFDEPSIKADFKKALNQLVDNELKKQKQKYKKDIDNKLKEQEQKIKDDLKKELEKKLKNMFKF